MTNSVKDVKDALKAALKKLEAFDENNTCIIDIDDNCGGSYECDINDFTMSVGRDGNVYISNY